jgi:flagellar biosynthesis chaperone FliJ
MDVDASAARRDFAVQLAANLEEIDACRADLARQIALCRQALIRADQAVKSLERLAEKRQAEFVYDQERCEARALEETWQASQNNADSRG